MDYSPIKNMTKNLAHAVEEEEANSKFKKLISMLPKEKRVIDFMDLYQYQGFWYLSSMLKNIISAQENFKFSHNDIYVCSSPKTGTTWLKALCYAIATRDQFNIENSPLLTNLPQVLIPSLELEYDKNQDIPLISSHLPFSALPKSVQSLEFGTKMIYICREPKDTFISLWHFRQRFTWLQQGESDGTTNQVFPFEKEFELFCEGKTIYGPYWDHVLGYWKESLKKPESLLFLKYEELTKDTLFFVRKMAEFMRKPFSKDEEGEGVPERIVKLCSFDSMRNLEVIKKGKNRPIGSLQIDNSAYFRKGKTGDWKNHLTPNMTERMDQITEEKLRGSSFKFGVSTTENS